jgi:steroid 5-alpha reductase family enzyme
MLTLLGLALLIAVAYFTLTWAISVRVRNYGFLDVAWSYGVAILAPIYALNSPGAPAHKWPVVIIGALWSLRLGTYILLRVVHHHPTEDVRYETLRKRWPGAGMFYVFFQMQAVLVVIFSLPFLIVSFNTAGRLGAFEIAGLAVAILSLGGEALADWQLKRFKADSANRGKVCQAGLWRYSRHPNYFFESLIWWAFFLTALGSPYGWITILCPLLMLYFLWKVTGIPLTEEHAVRSKGDAYREYQRTVSAFVPWFRRPTHS